MNSIEIKSPAKINIGLNIVSKRVDGFHDLKTFFYPLNDLHDTIFIKRSDKFSFECSDSNLPNDDSNLVIKAVRILEKTLSRKFYVEIKLQKKIPYGAGLGGGSSNAGAILISLNEMFELNLDTDILMQLALELGSDVPFFIKAKAAVGSSRGEILKYSGIQIKEPILIINPGIHVSTKDAFQNINPKPSEFDYKYFIKNEKLDYDILKKWIVNDFEKFVFEKYPIIHSIKKMLYENGALLSLMSGTGSTVFGIFADLKSAETVLNKLPGEYFSTICFDHN